MDWLLLKMISPNFNTNTKNYASLCPEYFTHVTKSHENCHTLKTDLLPQAEIKNIYDKIKDL